MSWGWNPKPLLSYAAGCSGENVAQRVLRLMPASQHEHNVFLCREGSMTDNKRHVHFHHRHLTPEP